VDVFGFVKRRLELRRRAESEAERLIAMHGDDAWSVVHDRCRDHDRPREERAFAFKVRRIIERRLGMVKPSRPESAASTATAPPQTPREAQMDFVSVSMGVLLWFSGTDKKASFEHHRPLPELRDDPPEASLARNRVEAQIIRFEAANLMFWTSTLQVGKGTEP
jgi:hypothetical protein